MEKKILITKSQLNRIVKKATFVNVPATTIANVLSFLKEVKTEGILDGSGLESKLDFQIKQLGLLK